jgi:hypothetical protein
MLRRLAFVAVAAGVAVLSAAGPASANSTIGINPGNIKPGGTLATGNLCDIGNGPYSDQDVWVFVLPGPQAGEFVTVTASFDTNGDGTADKDVTIPTGAYPSGFVQDNPQAPKAWIALPQGWALTGATAVITGTADKFNLTHTCAAGSTPSPSPSVSRTPESSPSPSPSGSAGPSESPSTSPSESTSSSPGASPSESSSTPGTPVPSQSSGGGLPTTGVAVTTYALTGTLLIAVGVFALLAARRRRTLGDHETA